VLHPARWPTLGFPNRAWSRRVAGLVSPSRHDRAVRVEDRQALLKGRMRLLLPPAKSGSRRRLLPPHRETHLRQRITQALRTVSVGEAFGLPPLELRL